MKKLIAALLSASVMLSTFTAFAEPVVKINHDFDGNSLGGWGGIANFKTVVYPEESENNCLMIPTGTNSQITHTPGVVNSYYGKIVFSGEFYPMESSLNVNIFLRYFAKNATSGTNTYIGGPSGIAVDSGGNIKVANRAVNLGKCEVGTKYSYKLVNDQVNHTFYVYMNGIWGGAAHPSAETDSAEYPGYEYVGAHTYAEDWGPVGAVYVYNNTGSMYVDNFMLEAPDAVCTVSDFEAGSSEISFNCDQFINTDTIKELKLSRVGEGGITELAADSDYTVEWKTRMDNFAYAAVPTIKLAEPVGEDEQIIFDFSRVKDSYGRTLESLNAALPRNADSDALNAVYEDLSENWLTETEIRSQVISAPETITPYEGGSTVMLDYTVTAEDPSALELIEHKGGQITVTQPEIDDIEAEPTSFDKKVSVKVTMSCGSQPVKSITRDFKLIRRKLLDEAVDGEDEIIKALSDDDDTTAWMPEGGSGELVVGFDVPKAIGGIIAKGDYEDIVYSISDNGSDFKEITAFPVKAQYLKIEVKGTEEKPASLTALEPVTSSFYEDVIARAEDLKNLVYKENLSNLTSSKYLTLPKRTANGTPLSWSSSNRDVIDEYGTVTQTYSRETVILTAKAVDSKGNVIEIASVDFTATVAAKEKKSSGGGGGGGGGSYSHTSVVVPKVTIPPSATSVPDTEKAESTPAPEKKKYFNDMDKAPWAAEAAESMAAAGIINGRQNGIFAPEENITREEFIKIIVSAFDIKAEESRGKQFSDIPSGAWYAQYVDAAYNAGIIAGISDSEFGAGTNVTRQDMAVILKRTADYKKLVIKADADLPELNDLDSTSEYAVEAVKGMLAAGIMTGSGGQLNPTANATRAEAAVMMYRFINKTK